MVIYEALHHVFEAQQGWRYPLSGPQGRWGFRAGKTKQDIQVTERGYGVRPKVTGFEPP